MRAPLTRRIIPGIKVIYGSNLLQVVDIVNASLVLVEGSDGQRMMVDASCVSPETPIIEDKLSTSAAVFAGVRRC